MYVYPDQRVELRAPLGCPDAVVQAFLAKRSAWVQRKLLQFSQRPPRRFDITQAQPFLGEYYPLVLIAERPHGVWLAGGELQLRCRQPADVAAVLADWYRQQARALFPQRLAVCRRLTAALRLPESTLRLRLMRSRWGSCSSRGDITLNIDLVRYPPALIDYVVVHELCHLREFHHGPAFYRLMDQVLPDWAERRRELRRLAAVMPPWPTAQVRSPQ